MHSTPIQAVRLIVIALMTLVVLGGCAGWSPRDPVRVNVVGLEPLPGQGLEMRFDVRLRLQNPNERPFDYDGLAIELDLNDEPFAVGVSSDKGSVPRFGEAVFTVPVTVSALAAVRQIFALAGGTPKPVPYVLRGKLGGVGLGVRRFREEGTLSLPAPGKSRR